MKGDDVVPSIVEVVLKLVVVISYYMDTDGLRRILIQVLEHKGNELEAMMEIMAQEKITRQPPSKG